MKLGDIHLQPNCYLSQTVAMIKLPLTKVYAILYFQTILLFTLRPLHMVLPQYRVLFSPHGHLLINEVLTSTYELKLIKISNMGTLFFKKSRFLSSLF